MDLPRWKGGLQASGQALIGVPSSVFGDRATGAARDHDK
jgi:hypothetical protein